MAKKLRIYLADLVHDYRPNHFCTPLGIGFVAEYLRAAFPGEVELRLFKSPERLLSAVGEGVPPDIVGLSNYSWNYEINRYIAAKLAAEIPDTVIVQGGPHIRIDDQGITDHLRDHPWVDYYIMFEGELPMASLVGHMLSKGRLIKARDCTEVMAGVSYLNRGELIYLPRPSQKGELAAIPSPYLSGMLDEFLESPYYLPLIETNRGCPFACTFCAWGISVLNKVRRFDLDRIIAEIDYVAARSQSSHWYFTDANFGMFPRDVDIATAIRKAADDSPYFQRLSINWAKNSSKYCTEIQHILKGVCDPLVAVQSTDPKVLKHIKRDNIRMSTITDLVKQGRDDGIAMTTDVLALLPEETLESHFTTLRDVFSIGFESFNVGQIRMLPGSEMEDDETREKYALQTKYRLIAGFYGIYDDQPICEYEESIVATSTMSYEDMYTIRMVHFLAWALWNSGLGQPLLRYLFEAKGINPLDSLLTFTRDGLHPDLEKFLGEYKAEARTEWFDSRQDLLDHFANNYQALLDDEYLKLNLKYLARILLDPSLARVILQTIADQHDDSATDELVDFCLERILFIDQRTRAKEIKYSAGLAGALAKVYPSVSAQGPDTCRFTITEKQLRAVDQELQRFEYTQNPVRAVALALQNYGDKLVYD
ncbi:MAG: B12-binding domain-containing radical SAM protein, partial [Alphaproteobacteria bacterium]